MLQKIKRGAERAFTIGVLVMLTPWIYPHVYKKWRGVTKGARRRCG